MMMMSCTRCSRPFVQVFLAILLTNSQLLFAIFESHQRFLIVLRLRSFLCWYSVYYMLQILTFFSALQEQQGEYVSELFKGLDSLDEKTEALNKML